jgi:polyhydroxybutyrate depolymerase
MKWTVEGVEREALVVAPAISRAKIANGAKFPVALAFHGHGGNMQQVADAGLQRLWPEAIFVYPQGLPTKLYVDPEGRGAGWQQEPGQNGDRDLKFVDAVLATLRQKFAVDERRIYATGLSNGGIFTYLLWGTRAKVFAAFAPVSGEMFAGVRLSEPKPLLHIAGDKDDVVPFARQEDSMRKAREVNGAMGKGESCGEYCTIYASSKGAPVETYIHPGGHEWVPESAELVVNFLKKFPQAGAK